MSQSLRPSDSYFYLVFASHNLTNNTVTCDELGIRYRIDTPASTGNSSEYVTSLHRWDREVLQEMLIAELEKKKLSHRVRIAPGLGLNSFGPEVEFVPVSELFRETANTSSRIKRVFKGHNGGEYVWKFGRDFIELYSSNNRYVALAKLKEGGFFSSNTMQLKLAQECIDILDEVLVTFMIAEKVRRDEYWTW